MVRNILMTTVFAKFFLKFDAKFFLKLKFVKILRSFESLKIIIGQ